MAGLRACGSIRLSVLPDAFRVSDLLRRQLAAYSCGARRDENDGVDGSCTPASTVHDSAVLLWARAVPRHKALKLLVSQFNQLGAALRDIDRRIVRWCRENETTERLATIPDIGLITASTLAASVSDASQFLSGRNF